MVALESDGPAAQAGLSEGDRILALSDQQVTSIDALLKRLEEIPVGVPADVVVLRGDRRLERFVIPGEYPSLDL